MVGYIQLNENYWTSSLLQGDNTQHKHFGFVTKGVIFSH